MDVVIPVADEPRNLALAAAAASIRMHAPSLRIVLIGHVQPHVAPYSRIGDLGIPMTQNRDEPVKNTNEAMRAACLSPLVSDPFLWSNDDIYWRRPVPLEEMVVISATAKGRLPNVTYAALTSKAKPYNRYELWQAQTADLLRGPLLNPPIGDWDYERHSPMLVEKGMMLRALELGGDKRTVYGNLHDVVPRAIKPDTKIWKTTDPVLPVEAEPFVSTGTGYPEGDLPRLLGLPESILDPWIRQPSV